MPDLDPDILLIPGLNNSGPGHWQTLWEETVPRARRVAQRWGSRFVDAGAVGHINARSGLGAWDQGLDLLRELSPTAVPSRGTPLPVAIAPEAPLLHWE